MKRTCLIFSCIIAILLSSCKKPGCIGSAGPVIKITRPLATFNQLVLDNNINLVLTQGNEEKIEIEAPKNIEPNIKTTISGTTLTIMNDADCRWARDPGEKINVRLYFKDLREIDYKGSGDITNTDTLKLEHLSIGSSIGAGNINLTVDNVYTGSYILLENAGITWHGKSEVCFTYTNARGQSDMRDFVVKKMVIEYGGLADTYVNVTDELDAILYYKGNINYKGNPTITRNTQYSSGRLIKIP
ncbi:MAG: head GIN domain-containing protein [Chitinophagaceae bacterium]